MMHHHRLRAAISQVTSHSVWAFPNRLLSGVNANHRVHQRISRRETSAAGERQ